MPPSSPSSPDPTEIRPTGASTPRQHSILVIGCGSIGERHLRNFQRTGRATLTACDNDPRLLATIAAQYHVPTVANWEEGLAAGSFEACVICTPAPLHIPIAIRALGHGLDVLIEKPLSHSVAGVDDLIRARDRARRQVAVAYVLHSYPLLAAARQYLASAELGRIRHVTVTSGQHFPSGRPKHVAPYWKTYYRDRALGGGAIQDALTHPANWVESVIGPTDTVYCDCAHQALPNVSVEDTVNVCARNGDILVSYTLNQFQAPNEVTLQFNATGGTVKIELHRSRWGVFRHGDHDWTWHDVPPLDRDGPFHAQANAFLDQLEGAPPRICSVEAALQSVRFNLAALTSADGGVRISCQTLAPVTTAAGAAASSAQQPTSASGSPV